MDRKEIENKLRLLGQGGADEPCEDLGERIKASVPRRFGNSRKMDTVSIIIDLRVSKIAAAAAILMVTLLLGYFYQVRNPGSGGILADGKMVLRFIAGGERDRQSGLAGLRMVESLAGEGKEFTFYEWAMERGDANSVLMHWKGENGKYQVIFGDMHMEMVGADDLVKLQSEMLKGKGK